MVLKLIKLIVPVISVFVSYYLGQKQSARKLSREQALHRYNTFYVPLFTHLYAGAVWKFRPSAHSLEARSVFLDLITKNISLLGVKSQMCYPDFHAAYIAMLEYDDGNSEFSAAPAKYDRAFNRLIESAMFEVKALSKELRLPPITHTYEIALRRARGCRHR